ncbi:MAG: ComEC/Rec2 family competence protein [Pseudomonadota bacterium]
MLRLDLLRQGWAEKLALAFEREGERGAAFLWAPVFLGGGIALYFALPREPLVFAFPILALISLLIVWRARSIGVMTRLSRMIFLLALGASTAQLHVRATDTIMLPSTVTVKLQGVVERVGRRVDGSARYTIDLRGAHAVWEVRGGGTRPERVRLTARKGGPSVGVGQTIAGLARVGPPSGPAFPGAYDFSFQLWFDGIGGNGFFLGPPRLESAAEDPPFSIRRAVNGSRASIAETIRAVLPGESGALAVALIVGDRSGISEETAEHLRRSGLAHILAISGLHMALVAATVMFSLQFLGAVVPKFALHYPVKKWAAAGALLATAGYLSISGGSVSTQRAFIMIAIMLLAIMMDRRALTMRNVALAAFVVLLLAPEALLSPGFQMSFAAVAGLVATYEQLIRWKARRQSKPGTAGQKQRLAALMLRNISGLALTSIIAGLATGLFAAYHFHRVAPLGLIANLLAMPVVSILVMPMALLAMLAMPFALEGWALTAMAMGVGWVTAVADHVSNFGLRGGIGVVPQSTLLLGSMALLIVCLSRTWLKFTALPLALLAFAMAADRKVPDLLILENANQIAVLETNAGTGTEGGTGMKLLKPNAEKFAVRIWRQAYLPNADKPPKAKRGSSDFQCDAYGCSMHTRGITITHVKNTARLFEDCRLADILVIPYTMPNACGAEDAPLVIDKTSLARNGARAIYIEPGQPAPSSGTKIGRIDVVESVPAERPWHAHRFALDDAPKTVFAARTN